MRLCMPSSAHAGIDHPRHGRVLARRGIVDVPDHVARDLIKHDECFPAASKPLGAVGFKCTSCGFETYFRTCGRCGGEAVRPGEE